MRLWVGRAIRVAALVMAGWLMSGWGSPATACTGLLVGLDEALRTSPAIALVRILAIHGDIYEADRDLEVEEAFKGTIAARLRTGPLPWHICGDINLYPAGTRLVIAFDVGTGAGAPFPKALNPYWLVSADGRLNPEGIDDQGVGWRTIDELRAGIAARLGGLGTVEALPAPPVAQTEPAAFVLPLLLAAFAGALLFGTLAMFARRRSRG